MKKLFLNETEKRELISKREQMIIESFANNFNKIKRVDEDEIKLDEEKSLETENAEASLEKSIMQGIKSSVKEEENTDFAKTNFDFDEEREIFDELNQNFYYDLSSNKVKVFGGAPYTSSFDLASDILGDKYTYEEKREVYDRVMNKWKESQKRFR